MAFKFQGMRRDILVRDILFLMLGHESTVKDMLSKGCNNDASVNRTLVDVSVDLADRLWNATHVYLKDEENDRVDGQSQLSPIVLDGDLGDL